MKTLTLLFILLPLSMNGCVVDMFRRKQEEQAKLQRALNESSRRSVSLIFSGPSDLRVKGICYSERSSIPVDQYGPGIFYAGAGDAMKLPQKIKHCRFEVCPNPKSLRITQSVETSDPQFDGRHFDEALIVDYLPNKDLKCK